MHLLSPLSKMLKIYQKFPKLLVVGDKEQETNMVAVRSREDGDIGTKTIEEFIKEVQEEKERRDK